jgi:crotonobetainyl-CoA:carnitine CoA-transferase CaiB-like acyl-CoA transferase
MILGDLGAEIIKIEGPGGDFTRKVPPHFHQGLSMYFLSMNRNKKSVGINLKSEPGREVFYQLVEQADVVFDNFRAGVTAKLNIDYETLKAYNPRIITCSLSGYGSKGPLAGQPAYDLPIQAFSGGMSLTGEPGRPPVRAGIPIADLCAGMFAAQGIMAALYFREKTGKGQPVETSLLGGQIGMLAYMAGYYFKSGQIPGPVGSGHQTTVPYGAFKTTDGWIALSGGQDQFWPKLCKALKMDEMADDERFHNKKRRQENRDVLHEILSGEFEKKSTEEWLNILREYDIPAAPVHNLEQALNHPQVLENNLVLTLSPPEGPPIKAVGNPVKMPAISEEDYTYPPSLGQHTDEILSSLLGYSQDKISSLREKGIVF